MPLALDFTPDDRVLWFTMALAVLTGVAFGLAPALWATRADLLTSLKDGSGSFGRFHRFGLRRVLVTVQVAISLTLLVSAGLFLRSLGNASSIDTGMRPENVLVMGFNPKLHSYSADQTRAFLHDLRERVSLLPGVRSMSYVDVVPLSIGGHTTTFSVNPSKQDDADRHGADVENVGGDYFRTMGIPLVRGRDFSSADLGRDAAIINQAMAERMFERENPLGRQIYRGEKEYEVIGVVGNTKSKTHGEDQSNCFYSFLERDPEMSVSLFGLNVILKTDSNPRLLERAVRQELHTLDPNLAIYGVETMEEHFNKALPIPRVSASLFSIFGAVGLMLATVGLYGVISYSVRRRTKEIGIRMALGASAGSVLADVLRKGMSLAGVGLLIGLAGAAAISRLFQSYLYGMEAIDPFTFVAVPLALMAVALVAILVPARRASRVEPSVALRYE
jgi:predicted permease